MIESRARGLEHSRLRTMLLLSAEIEKFIDEAKSNSGLTERAVPPFLDVRKHISVRLSGQQIRRLFHGSVTEAIAALHIEEAERICIEIKVLDRQGEMVLKITMSEVKIELQLTGLGPAWAIDAVSRLSDFLLKCHW